MKKGKATAYKRQHANILLKADISSEGDAWNDAQISQFFVHHLGEENSNQCFQFNLLSQFIPFVIAIFRFYNMPLPLTSAQTTLYIWLLLKDGNHFCKRLNC